MRYACSAFHNLKTQHGVISGIKGNYVICCQCGSTQAAFLRRSEYTLHQRSADSRTLPVWVCINLSYGQPYIFELERYKSFENTLRRKSR